MEDNVKYGIGAKAVRRDEFTTEPGGGFGKFKAAWSGQFTKVLVVSLFCLVLVAPAIACVIIAGNYIASIGSTVAYGAFDGIGYVTPSAMAGGGLDFAVSVGNRLYHDYSLVQYALLIPLIAVGGVGIGALTYTARMAMNGQQIKAVRFFLRGVRYTWAAGLTGGLLSGAGLFLIMLTHCNFMLYGWATVGEVFALIAAVLLFALICIYSFYLVTLSANYKMGYFAKLADALKLTFVRLPSNLVAAFFAGLIVGAAFLLIMFLGASSLGALPWAVLFFVGFYAICAIFVSSFQSSFEKLINPGLEERETTLKNEQYYAAKRELKKEMKKARETAAEGAPVQKKTEPARYVNPKKKKKQKPAAGEPAADNAVKTDAARAAAPVKKGGYTAAELDKMEEDRRKVNSLPEKDLSGLEDVSAYEDDGEL